MNAPSVAQTRVDALTNSLRLSRVERVEVFQIPPRILTRTRVTPEMLERSYHYKMIIRDMRGGAYNSDLLAAVASTSVQPVAEMGDLRWGLIFFDATEQRVASLYFDASGRRGAVDSIPVSFNGDLGKWLDANFSRVFK
ncbi:MAG TPA: hypothetical protein VGM84_02705 [Steroidobacteraceae bacterium]